MTHDPTRGPESPERSSLSHSSESPLKVKLVTLAAVVIPFAGLVVAILLLWGIAFDWIHLVILGGMYLATAVGITVGYHRLFTHRSFKTSRPVTAILAALGSMAVEGPVLDWVAVHRRHHQHSDQDDDPHSPNVHEAGFWNTICGVFHAHMGWLLRSRFEGMERYTRDLRKDELVCWMSRLFPLWVFVGLLVPAALGGVLTLSWMGALLGFIWGGLVRVFLVQHVTWSINSVCHIWGTHPFRCHDESRNNAIFGVLALGEGWHNNHHAFPTSARHGLRWWELDVSYMIIWAMSKIGLARDVRIPTKERIIAKQIA